MALAPPPLIARRETSVLPNALCGGGHSPSEGRAFSRTPYGWGVAPTEEIIEYAIAGSSRRAARAPTSVLPHRRAPEGRPSFGRALGEEAKRSDPRVNSRAEGTSPHPLRSRIWELFQRDIAHNHLKLRMTFHTLIDCLSKASVFVVQVCCHGCFLSRGWR
jgi:hypothetical protein